MAIDPTIALQAGQGVTPLQSPIQQATNFAQLQGLTQQNQLGGIQVQQGQMGLHDQQVLSQLMQSGKYNMGDPNSVRQMATDAGQAGASPNAVMALSQKSIDQQQKIAETAMNLSKARSLGSSADKNNVDLSHQASQDMGKMALDAMQHPEQWTQDKWTQGLAGIASQYRSVLDPKGQLQAGQLPDTLAKYQQLSPGNIQMALANATTFQKAYEVATPKVQNGPNGQMVSVAGGAPGAAPTVTPIGAAPALSPVAKAAEDLKNGLIDQNTYNQIKNKETHIAPAVNVNMANNPNFDPSAPLNPIQESAARDVLETGQRMTPSSRNPYAWQVNARADYLKGQQGGTIIGTKADVNANTQSLVGLQKNRDAVVAFENTAGKNLDMAINLASKIPDSGSPWVNTPLRSLNMSGLGSADQAAANAARQVANNEIAKVTSSPGLTGQLSDSARHEVEAYNPQNATFAQTVAVAKVLRQDMANRHQAYDSQLAEIKGRMNGEQQGTSSQQPGITPGMVPKRSDGSILPDGHYHGFVVQGGKVTSVG